MTEKELIELYIKRDERATTETEKHYGKLIRYVLDGICKIKEDKEECENDTYLQLWNIIPPNIPNNFKAFACKVARNIGLKLIEKNNAAKRKAEMLDCYEELEDCIISGEPLPEESFEAKELGKVISEFLLQRPMQTRVIFIKRYWLFEKTSQIAKEMGMNESSVKTSLFRTRKELGEKLKKGGYYG